MACLTTFWLVERQKPWHIESYELSNLHFSPDGEVFVIQGEPQFLYVLVTFANLPDKKDLEAFEVKSRENGGTLGFIFTSMEVENGIILAFKWQGEGPRSGWSEPDSCEVFGLNHSSVLTSAAMDPGLLKAP